MLGLLTQPAVALAALLTLAPFLCAGFFPRSLEWARRLPLVLRILAPALLGVPYALVSVSNGV